MPGLRCLIALAVIGSFSAYSFDTINTVAGGPPGEGGLAVNFPLQFPQAVAVDPAGNTILCDSNGGVYKVDAATGRISSLITIFGSAESLAINAAGILYFAEPSANTVSAVINGVVVLVAGDGTAGFFGDNGLAPNAQLFVPISIALDGLGNLYIADSGNNRIRRVSATTGIITTIAGLGTSGFSGDGGLADNAELNFPTQIAFDSAGNLYVADDGNFRLRRITPGGTITTIAGDGTYGSLGDGGPASAAQISSINGLAVNAAGDIFISLDLYRVRKITASTGIISIIVGNGTPGFAGDGGPGTSALVNTTRGLAVSANGLLMADHFNHRIRLLNNAGTISTVVGNGNRPDFFGDGGPAKNATFSSVGRVARDASGNIFVADLLNNRLRRITPGGVLTTFAGNGTFGSVGDGGQATLAATTPDSVALDGAGNVYIVETTFHRVRKIAANGVITTVAGDGTGGNLGDGGLAINAQLNAPKDVAFDSSGNMYIADSSNFVVRKVNAGGIISTFAGTGSFGSSGNNGPATSATFSVLRGVVVDSSGNVFVSDASTVRKINVGGTISLYAGTGLTGFSGDGGPATSAQLDAPMGLTVNGLGDLFIGEPNNARIRKVVAGTGVINTVVGGGTSTDDGVLATNASQIFAQNVVVDASNNLFFGSVFRVRRVDGATAIVTTLGGGGLRDGGPALGADIFTPEDVAADAVGNIYIADSNSRIRKVDPAGNITTFAGTGSITASGDGGQATAAGTARPVAITVDSTGRILFIGQSTNRVRRIDPATGIITAFAGTGVSGFSGDGGLATAAQFNSPSDLAADSAGNIYVADRGNARVRRIDAAGNISTFAGNGIFGVAGDGGAATAAALEAGDVALDSAGNLYISDESNSVVRKVTAGIISTVAGNGVFATSGDGGPATSASLKGATGIALDAAGNLYISTTQGRILRKVNSAGIISTFAGNGANGFSGDGGDALLASIDFPRGLAIDSAGRILIADTGNSRIRSVTLAPSVPPIITSPTFAVSELNQPFSYTITATNGPTAFNAYQGTAANLLPLPAGLTINTSRGVISGIPTVSGAFNITIEATNTAGTGSAVLSIGISSVPFAGAPVVTELKASPDILLAAGDVTITAQIIDGDSTTVGYTLDFGDGAPVITGTHTIGAAFSSTHTYLAVGDYTVTLTVNDGSNPAFTSTTGVFTPSSGGLGVANIGSGEVINPLTGIGVDFSRSNGGVVELNIDITPGSRAPFFARTVIAGTSSVVTPTVTRDSLKPIQKFKNAGIFVATSTAFDLGFGNAQIGRGRRMISVSRRETGEAALVGAREIGVSARASSDITITSLKGKFNFIKKTKLDTITFKGTVEIPAGFDTNAIQPMSVGIGNIIDDVDLLPKGKTKILKSTKPLKKLKVKYPKPPKGSTILAVAGNGTITMTFSLPNATDAGFDTEGITPEVRADEANKTTVDRKIQVALLIAGVPYEAQVPVEFKVSKKKDSGNIRQRVAGN